MSEYNDLKNIGKKEYVEKESLAKHIDNSFGEISTPFVVKEIRNFPVSDVVEVVRCKDCKYLSSVWIGDDLKDICKCGQAMISIKPDFYCSYGERRSKNMRDRLVELIVDAENAIYQEKPYFTDTDRIGRVADHILAEGIIVPPCKVGQTVYCIRYDKARKPFVKPIGVLSITSFGKGGFTVFTTKEDTWGITAFSTAEAAEKAIAERREE
jgi:hypothetical protein